MGASGGLPSSTALWSIPAMGSIVGWMREMPETRYTSTPEGTRLADQVSGDGTFNLVIPTRVRLAVMNVSVPLPLRNGILGLHTRSSGRRRNLNCVTNLVGRCGSRP